MTTERVSGATFDEVVDIARQIEMVRSKERVEREANRPHGQGGFSGAHCGERVSGATFDEVVDIACQIEMVRSKERVEREANRPHGQGEFSGALCGGQFQHGRGRPFRHAQTACPDHRGVSSSHGSHSYQQDHSSLGALLTQSSSCAPSGQASSMPGPSASYPGARGSLQSPAPATGSCYKCGEFGHMRRECPRIVGGPAP
ncbi:uncharacterized protein [Nicotiana tomentosiformis]|uniref:uncharacterized protein n=1 Tax=Nicotiana tomentosiformis TaxID=4098 RepID=UPI00388C7778